MATPRRLEVISGELATEGTVVTWVLEQCGDRVVVASRHRDGLPAFLAALRDERRMAAYQPLDAATRRRVGRLTAGRVDVVVHAVGSEAERVVATRPPRPARSTKAYFPRLLP